MTDEPTIVPNPEAPTATPADDITVIVAPQEVPPEAQPSEAPAPDAVPAPEAPPAEVP